MANFLKLNKSYLGPEVLSNGSFEEYGPEIVQNPNFESSTGFTLGTGWSIDNNIATHEGSAGNLGLNASYTDGKTYLIKFTIDSIDGGVCNVYDSGTAYTYQSFDSAGTYTVSIEKVGTSALALRSDSVNCKISSVSLKESGVVELVDNGLFAGITNGTAVTTALPSQWTFSNLASADIESSTLECISNGTGQFAYLQLDVSVGAEYRFKVDSVTGDLAANSIRIGGHPSVDVTGGSGELVFTATLPALVVQFYAGDGLGVAQTNYTGISIQATNQFAYGYLRPSTGGNRGGSSSVFDLPSKSVTFFATQVAREAINADNATTANQEYLVKFDVAAIVGSAPLVWYNGTTYVFIKLKVGKNEFRYKAGSDAQIIFGIQAQDASQVGSSITLNSISLQEVVNQPKLIGIDNVSMVSAPTDNTVVINNGLTDGADNLTITYAGASASSRVQMRNFFQDSIIRLANGNNTAEVLEITPPVLITDIVAS